MHDLECRDLVDHTLAQHRQIRLFDLRAPFLNVTAFARALIVNVDRFTGPRLNTVQQGRLDVAPAVHECRVSRHQPEERRLAGAKCHGEIWLHLIVETEILADLDDRGQAEILGQTYRHHVARQLKSQTQGGRAIKLVRVVLRPVEAHLAIAGSDKGRVKNDARRGPAIQQGCGVDEGFERGTGLTARLCGAVELALLERIPPDHGQHAAGIGVNRDNAAVHLGNLPQTIGIRRRQVFGILCHVGPQRFDQDHVAF